MHPSPIPDAEVWAGSRRLVIAAPDGDLTRDDIAPVEVLLDQDEISPRFAARIVLDDSDVEKIVAGARVFWYVQRGEHLHPFWFGWADE